MYLCVPGRKLNIIEEIPLQHPSPTSYGLLLSPAWCWSCQQSSELQEAGNRAEETCKRLSSIHRETDGKRERRERWGLEVVWLEPPGSHLTRQGRNRENRESGEQESSRGRTPQESSPASSRLPARKRSSHPSHFLPFPLHSPLL